MNSLEVIRGKYEDCENIKVRGSLRFIESKYYPYERPHSCGRWPCWVCLSFYWAPEKITQQIVTTRLLYFSNLCLICYQSAPSRPGLCKRFTNTWKNLAKIIFVLLIRRSTTDCSVTSRTSFRMTIYLLNCKIKINNLNSHPLEVVSRYRDPQFQVNETYFYLLNLQIVLFKQLQSISPNNSDLIGKWNKLKTTIIVAGAFIYLVDPIFLSQ